MKTRPAASLQPRRLPWRRPSRPTGGNRLFPQLRRLRLEPLEDRCVLSVQPFPLPLAAVEPPGSLIYRGSVESELAAAGEMDSFTIDLDGRQTLTLLVDPDATLQPVVGLLDPQANVIGLTASGSPGEQALLQVVPATAGGPYTIIVGGASDTIGSYTTWLTLDAAMEREEHDGPSNDKPASAEDLGLSFLSLAATSADRGAVLGRLSGPTADPGELEETIVNGSFETGDFSGWTAVSSGGAELTPWTVGPAGGGFFFNSSPFDGVYSAYNGFDGRAGLQYELYQDVAIPPGFDSLELTTNHRIVYTGGGTSLQDRLLEISLRDTDGNLLETLYTETVPGESTPQTDLGWNTQQFSILGYGGRTVRVHFRESIPAGYAGPALIEFDGISLPPDSGADWYRFELDDGRSTTLALQTSTPGDVTLELYDASVNLLAKGTAADNLDQVINNYVDATADGVAGVYFVRVDGDSAVDYRLVVTRDADFEVEPSNDSAGAQNIMPATAVLGHSRSVTMAENQKLIIADGQEGDEFGRSVSVSGEMAIIGASGVDGGGAAYAFRHDGARWIQQQELRAADATYLGISAAMDGHTAIVGGGTSGAGAQVSAAYVFRFQDGRWVEQQRLRASDGSTGKRFGGSVSLSGNTAIVGAPYDREAGVDSGSAYVFTFDGTRWVETQKLTASDASRDDRFGTSVSVSGDTAMVGAPLYYADGLAGSGSVYVFRFDGTRWVQQQELRADVADSFGHFGCSVSISEDTAVVGAELGYRGSAYVFRFHDGRWVQQQRLVPSEQPNVRRFGSAVAVSAETVAIGSDFRRAYVFRFEDGAWAQRGNFAPSDLSPGGEFGQCVAVDGLTVLVGDYGDDGVAENAGAAYVFSDAPGEYSLNAEAGNSLVVATATPADGPGQPDNRLDPALELYGPDGTLVADDRDSAPDGRNARLEHATAVDGTYTVRVLREGFTHGEYLLSVTGQTAPLPPFEVAQTDPADAELLTDRPVLMTVRFNDPVLASSLEAGDLTVNGVPARAVRRIDNHTAVFYPETAAVEGLNRMAIAGGAVLDLQGTPIEPVETTFWLDSIPPRVITSSLVQDQIVRPGRLVYTASFSEPLDETWLNRQNVSLYGRFNGSHRPGRFVYDPVASTLTLEYAYLPEDVYQLTFWNRDDGLRDPAGNRLDGERHPITTVPSGDGFQGGDFVVEFVADADTARPGAFPAPVRAWAPLGSLIYESTYRGAIPADDTDRFEIDLDDGQTVTLTVTPDRTLQPTVQLHGPDGQLMASATASAAGRDAVVQLVPITDPGTYTVTVSGESGTDGAYDVRLVLNAALEEELYGGPANDDQTSAQDIDGSLVALDGGPIQRGAVLGRTDSDDWYRFTLGDGESATLALTRQVPPDPNRYPAILELYDAASRLLAVGAAAGNLSRVINNFVDATHDGTATPYSARVTCPRTVEYSLVINRQADFDTEPNQTPAAAQPIAPGGSVLGAFAFAEQAELIGSQTAYMDDDGRSVSISGRVAILGANRGGNLGYGSASVFRLQAGQWTAEQELTASDASWMAWFGWSVSIDGDTALVGAPCDSDIGGHSGSVYVFRFDGDRWVQQQKLTPSDAGVWWAHFGWSVAIDGDTAIVGTPRFGYGNDGPGSAYVFRFDGSRWVQRQELTPSHADGQYWFGCSVSLDGDAAVIGAFHDDHAGLESGAAYVFRFDGQRWSQEQRLTASDALWGDRFGRCVAIQGDNLLIGADSNDDAGQDSGSVYAYRFDGGRWIERQKLAASDTARGDRFGFAVSLDGDLAVVGARYGHGLNLDSGSAYLFRFHGGRWGQLQKLTASDGYYSDRFGGSVSLSGHRAVVAAYGHRHNNAHKSPLAYIFSVDPDEYAVEVSSGDSLVITTATPGDGPGEFFNELDPAVELYDPGGVLVAADDNGAADGRNARLAHVAQTAGTYTVRVLAANDTAGEYVLNVTAAAGAAVVERFVFYNNSSFDGHDPAADEVDDAAIAPHKAPLLPGQTATFANYTSFSRGINGIMIDIAGMTGTPTAADFAFRVGNDDDPAGWGLAPAPSSATVRSGQGAGASDRVTIVWPHNAVQKQWLQVTVLSGGNIGLAEPDVFYFGNAIGESGNSTTDAKVNVYDVLGARDNQRNLLNPAPIDFQFDFDRNARVGAVDVLIARNNQTHFLNALKLISVPGGTTAAAGRTGPRPISSAELGWLRELKQTTDGRRPAAPKDSADGAVDALLATAWV